MVPDDAPMPCSECFAAVSPVVRHHFPETCYEVRRCRRTTCQKRIGVPARCPAHLRSLCAYVAMLLHKRKRVMGEAGHRSVRFTGKAHRRHVRCVRRKLSKQVASRELAFGAHILARMLVC